MVKQCTFYSLLHCPLLQTWLRSMTQNALGMICNWISNNENGAKCKRNIKRIGEHRKHILIIAFLFTDICLPFSWKVYTISKGSAKSRVQHWISIKNFEEERKRREYIHRNCFVRLLFRYLPTLLCEKFEGKISMNKEHKHVFNSSEIFEKRRKVFYR